MKEDKSKDIKYSSITNVFIAIAFLIIGSLLFNNSSEIVESFSKIIGIAGAVYATFRIVLYIKRKNKGLYVSTTSLISHIGILIMGLLFLFLSGAFETAIRLVIGIWILWVGINKLIACIKNERKTKYFLPMLIISIALLLIGAISILVSDIESETIGIILCLYSIVEIASYILYKINDTVEEKDNKNEKEDKEPEEKKEEITTKEAKYIEKK